MRRVSLLPHLNFHINTPLPLPYKTMYQLLYIQLNLSARFPSTVQLLPLCVTPACCAALAPVLDPFYNTIQTGLLCI
jgi:hypothetical protein